MTKKHLCLLGICCAVLVGMFSFTNFNEMNSRLPNSTHKPTIEQSTKVKKPIELTGQKAEDFYRKYKFKMTQKYYDGPYALDGMIEDSVEWGFDNTICTVTRTQYKNKAKISRKYYCRIPAAEYNQLEPTSLNKDQIKK